MSRRTSAVHLFDAAEVGKVLVEKGREQGFPWRYRPVRDLSRDSNAVRKYAGALAWNAHRIVDELPSDLIHLHYGRHIKYLSLWPQRPFVLHFHGTDIRTHFLQPYAHDEMAEASKRALAVLYSTPDLRHNSQLAREDAMYFATPVDSAALPPWRAVERPTVVFSSRWDESKNAALQLEMARALVASLGPDVSIQGLDWGTAAAQARETGIELRPKMPRAEYTRWLAQAHVVIGQPAGLLAVSELEAIGIGVPVVMPLHPEYERGAPVIHASTADEAVSAVRDALADPPAASMRLGGPEWVQAHHDATTQALHLADLYDTFGLH